MDSRTPREVCDAEYESARRHTPKALEKRVSRIVEQKRRAKRQERRFREQLALDLGAC
jgi:hypothetical protein